MTALATYTWTMDGAGLERLDDLAGVRRGLHALIDLAGMTALGEVAHRFSPQGVSLAIVLAESHIAAHTWPETGTGYVTLTTCRPPEAHAFAAVACRLLEQTFGGRCYPAAIDTIEAASGRLRRQRIQRAV